MTNILPKLVKIQRIYDPLTASLNAGNKADEEKQHDQVISRRNVDTQANSFKLDSIASQKYEIFAGVVVSNMLLELERGLQYETPNIPGPKIRSQAPTYVA